jgi:hypothetical protein
MKMLPKSAPENDLSCEVFDNCLETLADLLGLLDDLVQDDVLEAALVLPALQRSSTMEDDVSYLFPGPYCPYLQHIQRKQQSPKIEMTLYLLFDCPRPEEVNITQFM